MNRATMLLSLFIGLGGAAMAQTPAPQAPAPVTAIRAGRLLDPDAGVGPAESDHPDSRQAHPRRRTERRDSRRARR